MPSTRPVDKLAVFEYIRLVEQLKSAFRFPNLRAKLILAFLVTVMLPLVGTGLYGNWTTSRTLQAQALDAARADLRLRAGQIEGYLGGVREDVFFLSRLDSLARVLATDPPTPELLANLQADLSAFAATHPGIFQIRYIAATGMEIVRVDSTPNGTQIVSGDRLQNKADRYYFSQAMQLSAGELYVSPLDLNREFGAIEIPQTPTIRYATPVFRPEGARAGIVILNLYAEPFLRFARATAESQTILALTDDAGYYLAHPDPSREWGSPADRDNGFGAAKDYPHSWHEIVRQAAGVFTPPPENWLVAITDEILPEGLIANDQPDARRVLVHDTLQPHGDQGPRWRLLYDVPRVNLFASVWEFRLTALTILFAAALVALFIAVSLARNLTAPILALTDQVHQVKSALPSPENPRARTRAGDEIVELTTAFNEMSAAINQHLDQLASLNRAGHHITARLERPAVLQAAARAALTLLPAEYCALEFTTERGDTITHTSGIARWAHYRSDPTLFSIFHSTINANEWRTTGLGDGYLCCAPLCVSGRIGRIEVYGANAALGDAASGNLLATLSTQISIALENAELYARLAARRAELQTLVAQLITAQEEERRIVAYDIHDGLIQMLVGARLQLHNFLADRAEAQLQKGLDDLGIAIAEARRVIEGLRPAALDDLGLVAALRQFAQDTSATCGCAMEFVVQPPDLHVPARIETTAFRIAQEAITNTRKYAGAHRLRVALVLADGALVVQVRDSGRGFDLNAIARGRGVGLMGMRERARLVGGECHIESAPGEGTTVRAILPLEEMP
ncbi:MAG: hypothetical protein HY782_09655 [Chloroflexi bacterium]|nr:hypothetical protein [Chloroflexota bacterium]